MKNAKNNNNNQSTFLIKFQFTNKIYQNGGTTV